MTLRIGSFNAQNIFEPATEPNRKSATAPALKTPWDFHGALRRTSHDDYADWAAYRTLEANIDTQVESGRFRKERRTVAVRTAARRVGKWKRMVHLDWRARPLGAITPC